MESLFCMYSQYTKIILIYIIQMIFINASCGKYIINFDETVVISTHPNCYSFEFQSYCKSTNMQSLYPILSESAEFINMSLSIQVCM